MTPTTETPLDDLPDEKLNELFAVEAAGLIQCDRWGPSSHPLMGVMKTYCGHDNCHPAQFWPPTFCTDANAVLPYLEKGEWRCKRYSSGDYVVARVYPDGNHEIAAIAPTFARAAVLALIKAKRASKV